MLVLKGMFGGSLEITLQSKNNLLRFKKRLEKILWVFPGTESGTGIVGAVFQKPKPEPYPSLKTAHETPRKLSDPTEIPTLSRDKCSNTPVALFLLWYRRLSAATPPLLSLVKTAYRNQHRQT